MFLLLVENRSFLTLYPRASVGAKVERSATILAEGMVYSLEEDEQFFKCCLIAG